MLDMSVYYGVWASGMRRRDMSRLWREHSKVRWGKLELYILAPHVTWIAENLKCTCISVCNGHPCGWRWGFDYAFFGFDAHSPQLLCLKRGMRAV
jgi:hypothetical protein